jgi:hypothetical protein
LGFGRGAAQPQSDIEQEDAAMQNHNEEAEAKRVEAANLRQQCQDYQERANALDRQVRDHLSNAAVIGETRALKRRCDEEHAGRLQQIEQDHQRQIEQIQQEHNARLEAANQEQNARLDAANQASRNELQNCLAGSASLLPPEQARQADAAATAIQAARRRQLGQADANERRIALAPLMEARANIDAGRDPLSGMVPEQGQFGGPMDGGRKSRRRGRKSRRGGRKSRRRGRKSRRGGAHCSPKSGKKCPYYKKHGYHKYGQHM